MAPLGSDACPFKHYVSPVIGSPIVEVCSYWFRLFLYETIGTGVPSLLLPMGYCLKKLPKPLLQSKRLIVASSNHEPNIILTTSILSAVNDALSNSPVFVQVRMQLFHLF